MITHSACQIFSWFDLARDIHTAINSLLVAANYYGNQTNADTSVPKQLSVVYVLFMFFR